MVDDRFAILPVPAVELHGTTAATLNDWHGGWYDGKSRHLDTPAAVLESPYVSIYGALTGHLVTHQVRVVRRVDEVPAQGQAHVLAKSIKTKSLLTSLYFTPGRHFLPSPCL